jgi:rare lipoprotein A
LVISLMSCAKKAPPPSLESKTGVTPKAKPGLRTQKPYKINGIWYYPIPSAEGYVEEGLASWYGSDFHGKPTACGEPFDMHAMTAAHKTLPLGTHVKVTHTESRSSIIVRVNDRGPFVAGRIIDLSSRASQALGIKGKGLAHVRIEAVEVASEQRVGQDTYWKVEPMPSLRYGLFAIQIGSFREPTNAYRLKQSMIARYDRIQILPFELEGDIFYRVQIGSYQDLLLARQEMYRLRRTGFGDAFVIAMEGQ